VKEKGKNVTLVLLLGCILALVMIYSVERDSRRMLQERYDLEVGMLRELTDTQEQLIGVLRQRIARYECAQADD
jgi:hypothetical protein